MNSPKTSARAAPRPQDPVVLTNARLDMPEAITHGAVVIKAGRIADIRSETSGPAGSIDTNGAFWPRG